MKTENFYGLKDLTHSDLLEIQGGTTDPFMHDLGYALGKVCGWIKNAINQDTPDDAWMLDVPPQTLFG